MKKNSIFEMDEIPYELLAENGLSQQMIDDLPQEVMDNLLAGRRTPVLPVVIDGEPGKGRISLRKTEEGIDVVIMPFFSQAKLDEFDEEQRRVLRSGGALLATIEDEQEMFYQLDDTTNQIMSCPRDVIERNLLQLKQEHGVSDESIALLNAGQPAVFQKDGAAVAFRIDLDDEVGVSMAKGEKVQKTEKDKLPHYSFGIYGCWVNDENGGLTYVDEEDYTQEMQDAQDRVVERVKSGMSR